jgi:hypothetical protein
MQDKIKILWILLTYGQVIILFVLMTAQSLAFEQSEIFRLRKKYNNIETDVFIHALVLLFEFSFFYMYYKLISKENDFSWYWYIVIIPTLSVLSIANRMIYSKIMNIVIRRDFIGVIKDNKTTEKQLFMYLPILDSIIVLIIGIMLWLIF